MLKLVDQVIMLILSQIKILLFVNSAIKLVILPIIIGKNKMPNELQKVNLKFVVRFAITLGTSLKTAVQN